MALEFNAAGQTVADTPYVTAPPFTFGCWAQTAGDAALDGIMRITDAAGNNNWSLRFAGNVAGDPVRLACNDGTTIVNASTTTGFTANTWHHICAVVTSATARAVFIDGGSKGTNTTSRTPTGVTALNFTGDTQTNNVRIAEPFIYDVGFSDAEVAALAAGARLLDLRPVDLVFYRRFLKSAHIPLVGGGTFTDTATISEFAHPPKARYPWRPIGGATKIAAGGGGTVAPLAMHQYRQRRAA